MFAPNHKLRRAVTALAIGNIGKQREAVTCGHGGGGHATGGCCDAHHEPRSHDTSRIAWARLMARVAEEFPLECPNCGGDIRLIAFITEPGPIRKIPTHLGEPLVRMGVLLGLIGDVKIADINSLLVRTQPAHLQKLRGVELDTNDRNIERARYLRQHFEGNEAGRVN